MGDIYYGPNDRVTNPEVQDRIRGTQDALGGRQPRSDPRDTRGRSDYEYYDIVDSGRYQAASVRLNKSGLLNHWEELDRDGNWQRVSNREYRERIRPKLEETEQLRERFGDDMRRIEAYLQGGQLGATQSPRLGG